MSVKLNPTLKLTKKKMKQLCVKQNGWVLDCVNEQKAKMKPYSAVKDKYLKYFVVRIPKKKRLYARDIIQSKQEPIDGDKFKQFLNKQKRKILQSRGQYQRRSQTERSYYQSQILHQKNPNMKSTLEAEKHLQNEKYPQRKNEEHKSQLPKIQFKQNHSEKSKGLQSNLSKQSPSIVSHKKQKIDDDFFEQEIESKPIKGKKSAQTFQEQIQE